MDKQLVKFEIETAVITALGTKYKDIDIIDGDSKVYAVVMDGLREYRELRLKIDDRHKDLKKDALEYTRAVDIEWHRLKSLLEPGEERLKQIRQVEDDRKAAIKAEKDRKEKDRVDGIRKNIHELFPLEVPMDINASAIATRIETIKELDIDPQLFQEFSGQAQEKKQESIATLELAYNNRLKWEKEETERKAESERLKIERIAQEAKEKELVEERRKIEEEKRQIERAEIERKAREEAKAQVERETREKAERELRERQAAEEEKKRQTALRPDRDKLILFADSLCMLDRPMLTAPEAQKIMAQAIVAIKEISDKIKQYAGQL